MILDLFMTKNKNPFEFIDAMSYSKDASVLEKNGENSYSDFLTNRHFSYFIDSIHFANMMNCYPQLDNALKFDFYFHQLRKKKRFRKWTKKQVDDKCKILSDFYLINISKAMEIVDFFSDDDIAEIESKFEKGGKENKK